MLAPKSIQFFVEKNCAAEKFGKRAKTKIQRIFARSERREKSEKSFTTKSQELTSKTQLNRRVEHHDGAAESSPKCKQETVIKLAAMDRDKADKANQAEHLEQNFRQRFEDDDIIFSGGIVFSTASDSYEYVPMEGFPKCGSLPAMSKIDFLKDELTIAERDKYFDLKTPQDEFGLPGKFFLRVEDGK